MLDVLKLSIADLGVGSLNIVETDHVGAWFEDQMNLLRTRPSLFAHSDRVAYFATKLAIQEGMGGNSLFELAKASLLHDIGQLSIPKELFAKKKLSESERKLISTHVDIAYNSVGRHLSREAIILLGHHWFQENPYPDPNDYEPVDAGMALMQESLALADQMDATLVDGERLYRDRSLTVSETREYLLKHFKNENLVNFAIGLGLNFKNEANKEKLFFLY